MFLDLVDFPIESERLHWEARQVVRDLNNEPHLLMRVKLSGTFFPQRSEEPFVRVGDIRSRFAEISDDGQSVRGYFDRPLAPRGVVEFGYGNDVILRVRSRFSPDGVRMLDPKRLPPKTRFRERFFGDDVIR